MSLKENNINKLILENNSNKINYFNNFNEFDNTDNNLKYTNSIKRPVSKHLISKHLEKNCSDISEFKITNSYPDNIIDQNRKTRLDKIKEIESNNYINLNDKLEKEYSFIVINNNYIKDNNRDNLTDNKIDTKEKNNNLMAESRHSFSSLNKKELIDLVEFVNNHREDKISEELLKDKYKNSNTSSCNSSYSDMFDIKLNDNKKLKNTTKVFELPTLDAIEDNNGYYIPRYNELLNNKYKVLSILGKGVFSSVVSVENIYTKQEFAIKILKNNKLMKLAGKKEFEVLTIFNNINSGSINQVVKMQEQFEHKNYLCIVFEKLEKNLRDILNAYYKGIGFPFKIVLNYAKQILFSLSFIHSFKIIHSDYNILTYNNSKNVKISDFGSCLYENEAFITSNIVPRYYRPPEIFFGLTYDVKVDIWSLGCLLYELFTSEILFPGKNNADTVRLILEIKGKPSFKMLKKGIYTNLYFKENGLGNFVVFEKNIDNSLKIINEISYEKENSKLLTNKLKQANLRKNSNNDKATDKDIYMLSDLIEKCLTLDPNKRISAVEGLLHPIFNSKIL